MTQFPSRARDRDAAVLSDHLHPHVDPSDVDRSLRDLHEQIERAWGILRHLPGGAVTLFALALERATPVVPCGVSSRPLSSDALNSDLSSALANYHPEEIRVVAFTMLSSLVDLVREFRGDVEASKLLQSLRHAQSRHS